MFAAINNKKQRDNIFFTEFPKEWKCNEIYS